MDFLRAQIAAHAFNTTSGEVHMEIVAPGAGVAGVFTRFISGEAVPGYHGTGLDVSGKGRILLRTLFSTQGQAVVVPVALDAAGEELGALTSAPDTVSLTIKATAHQTEGKYLAPLTSLSNEDVGASAFKIRILNVTGEVFMSYATV